MQVSAIIIRTGYNVALRAVILASGSRWSGSCQANLCHAMGVNRSGCKKRMKRAEKAAAAWQVGLVRMQTQTPPSDERPPRKLSDVPGGERVQGVVVGVTEFRAQNSRGQRSAAFGKMIIEVQLEKHGPISCVSAICRHKHDAFRPGNHVRFKMAWKYNGDAWSAFAKEVFPVVEHHWS